MRALCAFFFLMVAVCPSKAQQVISYQGEGLNNGTPLQGLHVLTLSIYTTPTGGAAIYAETQSSVQFTNGMFNILIGSKKTNPLPIFNAGGYAGSVPAPQYYLGVAIDDNPELTPRTQLGSAPTAWSSQFADSARIAGTATTALSLAPSVEGITGRGTSGIIPLWTGTSMQSTSKLADNGNTLSYSGANISTMTAFQIGGATVLSADIDNVLVGEGVGASSTGIYNTFVGADAGYTNTSGTNNTFAGAGAGYSNYTGSLNTFLGSSAGNSNTAGGGNTFAGVNAGYSNSTGNNNTFSGYSAGQFNLWGSYNTFTGYNAGEFNTTANGNTFLGDSAGYRDTTGSYNAFTGAEAGSYNGSGSFNTFSGFQAGWLNKTGSDNTAIGYDANAGSFGIGNLMNATAIGANAEVTQSNSLVLGSISGVLNATANTLVGIGTTAPRATLDVTATDAVIVPVGTTAQRPANPVQGMIRFNSTTGSFEGYNGTAWVNL